MVTDISNYDNISYTDSFDDMYYVCSFNCAMSMSFLFIVCMCCCILGYFNKLRYVRQSGGIYADLYTRELDRVSLYTEQEHEDDQGLIIRGKGIYNFPPKYSEN